MRVRRALVDDADAIERVRTDTWRDAYRGLLPDSLLDGLGYDGTRRRAVMAAMPPEQFVLVAEADGAVVGFCIGRPSRSPNDPFRGEVYAIYVLPEHQGRGSGRVLLEAAAMELLGRVGASTAACAKRTRQAAGEGEAEPYERLGGVHVRDEERELDGVRINESGYGWEDISRSLGGSSGSVQRM